MKQISHSWCVRPPRVFGMQKSTHYALDLFAVKQDLILGVATYIAYKSASFNWCQQLLDS
jgi:hypothetical protein